MSRQRLTVVLSQAQGKHPAKRALEEALAAALIVEGGLDVSVVPHLYDLGPEHTGRMYLESVLGDLVVLSWLFPRACFWLLDRDGIKGHWGESQLKPPADHDEDEEEAAEPEPPKGIGSVNVPDRYIYCLDLRDFKVPDPYLDEIRRIAGECRDRREAKAPLLVQLGTGLRAGSVSDGLGTGRRAASVSDGHDRHEQDPHGPPPVGFTKEDLLQPPDRRWYPVIDYSRCTNCMECIDFCLFGVYGVDQQDRILVEHQDNCKRGCPACSRVCPEHAIMFPDYKTPAIAGAPVGAVTGLKIDLTKLFGGGDAMQMAAAERDAELVKDGRDAVGLTVGIPKRQTDKPAGPKDDLDRLIDSLDGLEI